MTAGPRRRIAYCTVPKIGGTFNYFLNLQKALAPLGWDVLAPSVGHHVNALWDDRYVVDGCFRIVPEEKDVKRCAQALVDWCIENAIDVMIPMSVQAAVSAIPHLPPSVRAVLRCSNITRHAYDIVTEHLDRVFRVIATSKRQFDDLRTERRVPEEKLVLIPHGIDMSPFLSLKNDPAAPGPIRLIYVGRLLDSAKGIFQLPLVMDRLIRDGVDAELDVVGDGPDRERLRSRFAAHMAQGRVRLLGNRSHDEIPGLLASADVFLMPSRFEGFGFSLIEAMVSGVVPIASRIVGVTDWIIDDGRTGFVCTIDDAGMMAERIARLARNGSMMATMKACAREEALRRFDLLRLGRDYADLLETIMAEPALGPARPWSEFRASAGFEPTFRRWIPNAVKDRLRAMYERWMK